ncbi:hypothetical protein QL285_070525 [Trifolium repens]|nr:hypothetical protein QL285_070525 [Trifolium repens]
MNPFDFYYLDDFLKFSPLSPNYANLNMVSSLWLRSPRSTSASLPVPENSFGAYHKEIYTVLFYPPSFLMVYSIVRHLWKKWKMKKFLPLPPLHKSLQAPFDIQGPLLDSASEEEGESSPRVSYVPESVSTNPSTNHSTNHHCNFSFGNFHSETVPIRSIEFAKPEIKGCTIKIGEISCILVDSSCSIESALSASEENEKSKHLDLLNQEVKVGEKFHKFKAETSNHISDISFATIAKLKNDFQESMDLVQDSHRDFFSITVKNHCEFEGMMLLDQDLVSIQMCRLLHRINNTALPVKTVFDPGGVVEVPSVATFGDTITLTSLPLIFRLVIVLAIEFSGKFVITIFDPGGTMSVTYSSVREAMKLLELENAHSLFDELIQRASDCVSTM